MDFAYAVHTDVGNRTVAAKIDRRLVPLRTAPRNGQTVEIITAKGAHPNPAWTNFVVTAKARAAIRTFLKTMKHGEAIELGRRMLDQALGEFKLSLKALGAETTELAARDLGFANLDALCEQIGLGERLAPLVARRLLPADASRNAGAAALEVAGTEGLLVSYARCCFPIPYEPIIAYLSVGRGVVIHRADCANLSGWHKQPEKWLPVSWQPNLTREFPSELRIEAANRVGVLAALAAKIAAIDTNISHVSVTERDDDTSTITFELQIRDRRHLAQVIRAIRRMPDVLSVQRTAS